MWNLKTRNWKLETVLYGKHHQSLPEHHHPGGDFVCSNIRAGHSSQALAGRWVHAAHPHLGARFDHSAGEDHRLVSVWNLEPLAQLFLSPWRAAGEPGTKTAD